MLTLAQELESMKSATATLQFELENWHQQDASTLLIALATDFNIERDFKRAVSKWCAIVHQPPETTTVDDRKPA